MTRDRLGDLNKVRNNKKNKKDEDVDVEQGDVSLASEGEPSLREAFERSQVLGQWIKSIEENTEAAKHYIAKLDDIKVSQIDLAEKIDSLFQNSTSISQKITSKLKVSEEELKNIDADSAEGRIKNIQYNTLKTRFQKAFKAYNAELENYKNIKKAQLEAQLRAKGVVVTDEELVSLLEGNTNIDVFTDNILAETAEAKRMLQDIEERHTQLMKIERMIVEVRDLFVQMAILVDNQQDLVDRVEFQAQSAQDFIGKGRKELKSAEKKKKKNIKCKVYLFIIVLVVLIIIVLTLIFAR